MAAMPLVDDLDDPDFVDALDDLLEWVLPTTRAKLAEALARKYLTVTYGEIDRAIDEWIDLGCITPEFDLLPDTEE